METHLLSEERTQGLERLWEMGWSSMAKTQAEQIGNCTLPKGEVRPREKAAPPQPVCGNFIYLSRSQIQNYGAGRSKLRLSEE